MISPWGILLHQIIISKIHIAFPIPFLPIQRFRTLRESYEGLLLKRWSFFTTEKDAGKVNLPKEGFLSEIPILSLAIEVAMVEEGLVIFGKINQLKVLNKGFEISEKIMVLGISILLLLGVAQVSNAQRPIPKPRPSYVLKPNKLEETKKVKRKSWKCRRSLWCFDKNGLWDQI